MGLLKRAKKIRKKKRREYNKQFRKQKFRNELKKVKLTFKNILSLLRKIILFIDATLLIAISLFILSLILVEEGIIDKDKYIEFIYYIKRVINER